MANHIVSDSHTFYVDLDPVPDPGIGKEIRFFHRSSITKIILLHFSIQNYTVPVIIVFIIIK